MPFGFSVGGLSARLGGLWRLQGSPAAPLGPLNPAPRAILLRCSHRAGRRVGCGAGCGVYCRASSFCCLIELTGPVGVAMCMGSRRGWVGLEAGESGLGWLAGLGYLGSRRLDVLLLISWRLADGSWAGPIVLVHRVSISQRMLGSWCLVCRVGLIHQAGSLVWLLGRVHQTGSPDLALKMICLGVHRVAGCDSPEVALPPCPHWAGWRSGCRVGWVGSSLCL